MKAIYISLILLFGINIQAQDYRFGKVSKEELQKENSAINPEAAAEILYESARVTMEYSTSNQRFEAVKEFEGRIKIYDKDNVNQDYLVKQVRLYSPGADREKVSFFKGVTYNLVNGEIVTDRVKNSDIFRERHNKYWESEKLTFPNVKNGSVLEYSYTVTSPNVRDMKRWFFQQEIPVVYSRYTFIRPEYFSFIPDMRGTIQGKKTENRINEAGFNYRNDITEFVYENLPALKDEAYVLNPDNLKASLRYELMKFEYPGRVSENFATTWIQIGSDLMERSDFGRQLNGIGFLDETVNQITASAQTPAAKADAIFNYVKNNYTWNNFRGLGTENGLRKTFKDRTGNASDINLLLVAMLRRAEIPAYPIVLSTVDNLLINYSFPSMTNLDFVIVGADISGGLYLMDATEKHSRINMLPLRDLNQRGFLILDKTVREVPLTNQALSSVKETLNSNLTPDGKISGNYVEIKDMYFAMNDKMRRTDNPKRFESNYLSDYQFDVSDFRIDENPEKGIVRYSFKFEDLKAADVIGDKIIVNPMLFLQNSKSTFTAQTRNYPLEFGSVISNSRTIKIKIPEGYKVESLPNEQTFLVEGKVAGYVYKAEEKDGHIIVSTLHQIGESILPAEFYEPMRTLENNMITTEDQQVILVKN